MSESKGDAGMAVTHGANGRDNDSKIERSNDAVVAASRDAEACSRQRAMGGRR